MAEKAPNTSVIQHAQAADDPLLVTWNGDEDPSNPRNWPFRRRWFTAALVSLFTFMTPIALSMVVPSLPQVGEDLDIHSSFTLQLIFSLFLLSFIVGPFIIGPMSELYGRRIILQLANVFFLLFTLLCGFARSEGELIAFRILSGLGGCAPQAIGGGVIGDLFSAEERGKAVALYSLAPLLGPALGPLAGGFVAEHSTWRWSFWSVVIVGVVVELLLLRYLKETYAPRILYLKAKDLRLKTGDPSLRTKFELDDRTLATVLSRALVRPLRLLSTQIIVQFLAIYMAVIYGICYLMTSTFAALWIDVYAQSLSTSGLHYLAIAAGLLAGMAISGRASDWIYGRLKARSVTNTGNPEMRIPLLFVGVLIVAGGLLIYGWSAAYHVHWIVPDLGVAVFSAGAGMSFAALQMYTIDAYTQYAASAISATAVTRSVAGFAFPLFAPAMYKALGYGWGNSVLALAAIAIGLPGASVLWFYGASLRRLSPYASDRT
ncbi:hypothetical protein AMS68_006771 [Peltaster fructicola]|uniref:Major facilitator superfamily (MFS) profile domain-containing protein n=1 Tax=Peltaster fructicola TaxID=286661 RepID=A0A6H0Y2M2_9PEZI|nr:hypothetical protein AMS68_006771 [Peltaster fructicola]